ncbi:MAG: ureidoglycolate lyase [Paraglaciecola psychrophila]|jgi:ureidoglycolate lyase
MKTLKLTLQPLTGEAFADFGDVIDIADGNTIIPINYGRTDRHQRLAAVDAADNGGEPIISIFHSQPISLPFTIKVMERHPQGSQAFINMESNPYVVVVGKAGVFDVEQLQAFLVRSDQGVNYHKGTWHHYSLCLDGATRFAVVDRLGPGNNCDEELIPDGITLVVDH